MTKLALALALSLSFAATSASANSLEYISPVKAKQAAILALTKALQGDIFEAVIGETRLEKTGYVFRIQFSKYHLDDSTGEMALIPCGVDVPVSYKTGKAEIQLDDNLMCFQ